MSQLKKPCKNVDKFTFKNDYSSLLTLMAWWSSRRVQATTTAPSTLNLRKIRAGKKAMKTKMKDKQNCYDHASWTAIFFPFYSFSPSPSFLLLYYRHPPFAPCNSLELDSLSDTKARTRCLVNCALPLLSITCLTLTPTVPPTCASVPADVHPSCPSYAHPSSLLPYVSLHHLCTLLDPLTCVTPCPLYTF